MVPPARLIIEKANILYATGQCDQAVNLLLDGVQQEPSQVELLRAFAKLLIDSGQYGLALKLLQNADFNEAEGDFLYMSGICHEALGDVSVAGKISDRLLILDGQRANALVIKARLAARSLDMDRAEHLFQDAIACVPNCGLAFLGLGDLHQRKGNWEASLDCLEKAFQADAFSREISIRFHETALALEKLPLAEVAFRQALCTQPLNRRLRFLLIDALLKQGKFADAMSEIESAMADFDIDRGILTAALNVRQRLGALHITDGQRGRSTVSLCMIVKNEDKHLARCLRSAKPLVDEIIIVDTGSIDMTRDIAVAFGAIVYDFPWTDNFSEARNCSLTKAAGDWVLVLDADEVISPQDRGRFAALIQNTETQTVAYCIQTRNYTFNANTLAWCPNDGSYPVEEQGMGWFPSEKVRLFPNHTGIRFSHPVHELVEPCLQELKIPIRACDIPVHHYGNLKEEKTLGKTRGYRAIGEKKLSRAEAGPAALRELAIQSSHLDRHAEAIDLWRKYLEKVPDSAEAYLNLGSACWQLSRYAEAREYAKTAQRLDGSLKEAAFNRALAELLLGKAGIAINILERLLRKTPGYLPARFILAAAYACSGKARKARAALHAIESTPLGAHLTESFYDLAKRLRDAAQTAYCEELAAAAMAARHADARFLALLESVHQAHNTA